jgi:hypothetical protein
LQEQDGDYRRHPERAEDESRESHPHRCRAGSRCAVTGGVPPIRTGIVDRLLDLEGLE